MDTVVVCLTLRLMDSLGTCSMNYQQHCGRGTPKIGTLVYPLDTTLEAFPMNTRKERYQVFGSFPNNILKKTTVIKVMILNMSSGSEQPGRPALSYFFIAAHFHSRGFTFKWCGSDLNRQPTVEHQPLMANAPLLLSQLSYRTMILTTSFSHSLYRAPTLTRL